MLRYADMESATGAMSADTSDVSQQLISLINMGTLAVTITGGTDANDEDPYNLKVPKMARERA